MKNKIILLLMVLGLSMPLFAQKTTKIWIVRHAEKDIKSVDQRDPDLSAEGKERAMILQKELKGEKIDSIYTTVFKRTRLTAQPLADKMAINIKTYNPAAQSQLADYIIKYGAGKNYLIVGHSNTVQELIVAFGLEKPVKDLTEDDYNYIFLVTVKGDKRDVKVGRYGAKNKIKEIEL